MYIVKKKANTYAYAQKSNKKRKKKEKYLIMRTCKNAQRARFALLIRRVITVCFLYYFTLRAAHNNKYGQIVDTLGKIKNTWQISGQTINGNY